MTQNLIVCGGKIMYTGRCEKCFMPAMSTSGYCGRLVDNKQLNLHNVITPLLTDKQIEEHVWENISVSLSQIDIDTHSDGYIQYLNAVYWAKWGRDNCNGL